MLSIRRKVRFPKGLFPPDVVPGGKQRSIWSTRFGGRRTVLGQPSERVIAISIGKCCCANRGDRRVFQRVVLRTVKTPRNRLFAAQNRVRVTVSQHDSGPRARGGSGGGGWF